MVVWWVAINLRLTFFYSWWNSEYLHNSQIFLCCFISGIFLRSLAKEMDITFKTDIKKELLLIEQHICFPVWVFALKEDEERAFRWLASGVNLHWTKWGAMGHSSPKLIASQRLTVSLHPPTATLVPYPLPHPLLRSAALLQPSSSFSLVLHTRPSCSSLHAPRVLATYIVPPNNVCPKGREITDFVGRRTTNIAIIVGRLCRKCVN